MKRILLFIAVTIALTTWAKAQELPTFEADLGKQEAFGVEVRVPYTDVISFYGYIKPGATPDEEKGGKKYYYLYVWIPVASPEIGLRMVSPVPKKMKPGKEDFVMEDYTANSTDTKSYFDTWISFERADNVISYEDIVTNGKTAGWLNYGQNDDNSELPKQPSGNKYNSQMRISTEVSNPAKALVIGLYRIGFTTYKTGEVQGSFIAQIGSVVEIPGVKVARDLESLKAALDSEKK
ncbi:MAG: hypothetical protein EHM58_19410 [Ignavibacteriae bacterium]|nr:MAG: hypothetical protein EHM58_19410 [Ignavibacteriota bacterium]